MKRLLFATLAIAATPAIAVEPDEILADRTLEARAREVSRQLRCVVCKSQSIDESDAPLARDLRLLVRERIVAGDTNEEALAFVVDRYGRYVLLKPPLGAETIALWAAPVATLGLAGIFGVLHLRRKPRPASGGRSGEPPRPAP